MESSDQTADKNTWGSHWHLRVINPNDSFIKHLEQSLTRLHADNYLTYAGGNIEGNKDGKKHYHLAIGTSTSIRQSTLINKLRFFKRGIKLGWEQFYCRPVYKESSPHKNWEYCTKQGITFNIGNLPDEHEIRTEIKAKDRDTLVIQWAKEQDWEKIERTFPGYWIKNGARLKGLYMRQAPPADQGLDHNKHLWLYGESGLGKTSIVEYLYPGHYRKRPDSDWLGWDSTFAPHKVVHLNDLDITGLKTLGIQLLKELCDPQGFNANVKYAGGEIINPSLVIVTSNFTISDVVPPQTPGVEVQRNALRRRFREVNISDFLTEQGLMLVSKEEIEFAKRTDLWDRHGYKCMLKPIAFAEAKDYHWLGDLEDVSDTETIILVDEGQYLTQETIDLTNDTDNEMEL